jgi:tRNA-modifying protein YgfZ
MESRVSAGFCMAREFARISRDGPFKTFGKTMLKPLTGATSSTLRRVSLPDLGAVRVQGADAIKFLQGQLSNDVAKLSMDRALLAGLHNPQGRAIALLRLVLVGPDDVLGLLPRELAANVAARLSKFVLRAKAKVTDASNAYVIEGVVASDVDAWADANAGDVRREASGEIRVCAGVSPLRWLALRASADSSASSSAEDREAWRALDIAEGIPQVYAATTEAFVAQILNLDVLGGISFEKGCYTGQEVIARAHYRGKVKRRLQRFVSLEPAKFAPGDSGTFSDGRRFKVVESVQLADGRSEFLAVAPMVGGDDEATSSEAAPSTATGSLSAEQLQIPGTPELPAG